jgi:hypothetical protein
VRATLRASVFSALHEQAATAANATVAPPPLLAALKHHPQGALALALVHELLTAAGCTHTLKVLGHEAVSPTPNLPPSYTASTEPREEPFEATNRLPP